MSNNIIIDPQIVISKKGRNAKPRVRFFSDNSKSDNAINIHLCDSELSMPEKNAGYYNYYVLSYYGTNLLACLLLVPPT